MDVEQEVKNLRQELALWIDRTTKAELKLALLESRVESIEGREVQRAKHAERKRRNQ